MTKINALMLSTFLLAGCFPMPITTPDEAPNLACPCPDLALTHHPHDPDSPGGCKAKSRTGQVMHAEDHPACAREARERAGEG